MSCSLSRRERGPENSSSITPSPRLGVRGGVRVPAGGLEPRLGLGGARVLGEPGAELLVRLGGDGPLVEPLVDLTRLEQRGRLPGGDVVEGGDAEILAVGLLVVLLPEERLAPHELCAGGEV